MSENTEKTVHHLPGVNEQDVEARAREIVEQKLANKRAKEMLREDADDILDKATDAVTGTVTKAVSSLRQWKQERKEAREERVTRLRAAEIAEEELIQKHMDEARRQLEQERQEQEQSES